MAFYAGNGDKGYEPDDPIPNPVGEPDSLDDICRICLKYLDEMCFECETLVNRCACLRDCRVAKGACDHMFHYHCIFPWLEKSKWCPVGLHEWQFDFEITKTG